MFVLLVARLKPVTGTTDIPRRQVIDEVFDRSACTNCVIVIKMRSHLAGQLMQSRDDPTVQKVFVVVHVVRLQLSTGNIHTIKLNYVPQDIYHFVVNVPNLTVIKK